MKKLRKNEPRRLRLQKYAPLAVTAFAAFTLFTSLFRPFWFDEVLTVSLVKYFSPSGGPVAIYQAYDIPNNHIVFSLILSFWLRFLEWGSEIQPLFLYRIPTAAAALLSIFLLIRLLRRKFGTVSMLLTLSPFCVSASFAVFGTALRGYMTGFLLTILAFLAAEKWMRRNSLPALLLYFLSSLLAVGTAPTCLAALTGTALMFSSRLAVRKDRGYEVWKWAVLLVTPPLSLAAFYLPILPKFLHCAGLGEGWFSAENAIWNLYLSFALCVLPALPFAAAGFVTAWRKHPVLRLRILSAGLVFLLPLPAFFVFKVPVFPRVFFPLFPLWLFWTAFGLSFFCRGILFRTREKAQGKNRRPQAEGGKEEEKRRYSIGLYSYRAVMLTCLLPAALTIAWMFLSIHGSAAVSNAVFGDPRQDDLYYPHYARMEDFRPDETAAWLGKQAREGRRFLAFVSFQADPHATKFYAMFEEGLSSESILFDLPNREKIPFLPRIGTIYLICSGEQDLNETLERFGFRKAVPVYTTVLQQIYEVVE